MNAGSRTIDYTISSRCDTSVSGELRENIDKIFEFSSQHMSRIMRKSTEWIPNMSDTNSAVQAQGHTRSLEYQICTIHVPKTKAMISLAVTADQLICAFGFAYAVCWFSHEAAHIQGIRQNMKRNGTIQQFSKHSYQNNVYHLYFLGSVHSLARKADRLEMKMKKIRHITS